MRPGKSAIYSIYLHRGYIPLALLKAGSSQRANAVPNLNSTQEAVMASENNRNQPAPKDVESSPAAPTASDRKTNNEQNPTSSSKPRGARRKVQNTFCPGKHGWNDSPDLP